MLFVSGVVLFFAALMVMAVVGRYCASHPHNLLVRGDIVPSLVAVFFASLMTVGLTMMLVGGEEFMSSVTMEMAVIFPLIVAGAWLATRITGQVGRPMPI